MSLQLIFVGISAKMILQDLRSLTSSDKGKEEELPLYCVH